MKSIWSNWNLHQRLGAVALLFAFVAIFARPVPGGNVLVSTYELTSIISREADHVTPRELARWIVEGRSDFRLFDLGDEERFARYHIPSSERLDLSALSEPPFLRNEKVVLYSDGGTHAAQVWTLLRARGYRAVYTVQGGLDAWKDEVLFPVAPDEDALGLAHHFGGQPRMDAEAATSMPPDLTPELSAPNATRVTPPSTARAGNPNAKPKKREGC